jgi:ABC-type uncharacterized transport system permease subunit
MNRKVLTAVLCGVLLASLVCIVVGLVLYFTALNTTLETGMANYEALSLARTNKLLIGIICMIIGFSCFVIPAVILLIMLISFMAEKIKRRKNLNSEK